MMDPPLLRLKTLRVVWKVPLPPVLICDVHVIGVHVLVFEKCFVDIYLVCFGFWILVRKRFCCLWNKMDFNNFGFKICGTDFIIWVSLVLSYGNQFYGFELAIYKYASIIYLEYEMISQFYYSIHIYGFMRYLVITYFYAYSLTELYLTSFYVFIFKDSSLGLSWQWTSIFGITESNSFFWHILYVFSFTCTPLVLAF